MKRLGGSFRLHGSTAGWWLLAALFLVVPSRAADQPTEREVVTGLKRAVAFFRTEVSVQGGYLWQYSADLSKREGEGRAKATTAWVQPPGTPTVGEAYLTAYLLTGEPFLLDAAVEAAHALVRGQLLSGGWDYRIEFDPQDRRRYAYRVDDNRSGRRNTTTLDDDTTQAALRFLMHVDQTLQFQDTAVHDAVRYALDRLLAVQYPNGAWPQRFVEPPDPAKFPVLPASYPETWSRTWPRPDYKSYYTFNDNTMADMVRTLFEAAEIYNDPRYDRAARKTGDFILLAQMPEPQPAWAQQYDARMHPAWARKFEPPAVTGGESQGVLRILLTVYRKTGDRKYLKPVPRALAYLKRSRLPDGRLARFYELKTNRPLYFTKDYRLTYSSDDVPTHYAFVVDSHLSQIESEYRRLLQTPPSKLKEFRLWRKPSPPRRSRSLARRAAEALRALDQRGAWVETGRLRYHGPDDDTRRIISTRTFCNRLRTLAQYLAACRGEK